MKNDDDDKEIIADLDMMVRITKFLTSQGIGPQEGVLLMLEISAMQLQGVNCEEDEWHEICHKTWVHAKSTVKISKKLKRKEEEPKFSLN